jgi:hypothetical protein
VRCGCPLEAEKADGSCGGPRADKAMQTRVCCGRSALRCLPGQCACVRWEGDPVRSDPSRPSKGESRGGLGRYGGGLQIERPLNRQQLHSA